MVERAFEPRVHPRAGRHRARRRPSWTVDVELGEQRERGRWIGLERRARLGEDRAVRLGDRGVALGDDPVQAPAAEPQQDGGGDRDDRGDRAMAREPAPDPLRERVAVCADELPGLEPAEIFGELARGRVARGGRERHCLGDDRGEIARRAGLAVRERADLAGRDAVEHVREGGALVRSRSRDDMIEHRAQRVDVRALIHGLAESLLGRHVRRGPQQRAGDRGVSRRLAIRAAIVGIAVAAREILGEAPVDHDGLAELTEQDVRGLEVAVDDAVVVRVRDRVRDGEHGR